MDELAAPDLVVNYAGFPEEIHGPEAYKRFLNDGWYRVLLLSTLHPWLIPDPQVDRAGLSHFLSSNVYLVGGQTNALLQLVRGSTPAAAQEDLMHTETAMSWRDAADTSEEDVALVRAAQQDRAAFAPLYGRYRQRVYAYLYTRLPHPEDAADLTQQVFVQALAALARYRHAGPPFAGWLFRIARNAVVDHHRRQRRGAVTLERVPEEFHPRSDQDLEAQVVQQEALAHLHAVLDTLDPATRDLLLLRFMGQLTAVEIGAAIGTSPSAASKRLQRALQTVKEHYHEPLD